MKQLIYTINFNNYDWLKSPVVVNKDKFDYICFTDNPNLHSNVYKIVVIKENLPPHILARKIFINSHIYASEYDASMSLGGQIQLNCNINFDILNSFDISIKQHPYRHCAYDEADIVIRAQKDNRDKVQAQVKYYEQEQFPRDFGLWETGIMIRKNNDNIKTTEQEWWKLINTYSYRDQLSLPFVLWKYQQQLDLKLYTMGWNMMNCPLNSPNDRSRPFIIYPHNLVT